MQRSLQKKGRHSENRMKADGQGIQRSMGREAAQEEGPRQQCSYAARLRFLGGGSGQCEKSKLGKEQGETDLGWQRIGKTRKGPRVGILDN